MTKLFLTLSAILLVLIGVAAAKDAHDHGYLAIQEQYLKDYPTSKKLIDVKTQQLFPSFAAAKRGDSFRVERCISCHVPDISIIGPQAAAANLSADFLKYEPDAAHLIQAYGLTLKHPALAIEQRGPRGSFERLGVHDRKRRTCPRGSACGCARREPPPTRAGLSECLWPVSPRF